VSKHQARADRYDFFLRGFFTLGLDPRLTTGFRAGVEGVLDLTGAFPRLLP